MSQHDVAARLQWALDRCRALGLRRTRALGAVLRAVIASRRPMTLADLGRSKSLSGVCDPATIYRLVVRLEAKGILRRLGLHDRAAYFTMKYPGEHHDYIVCRECGLIEELDIACPVEALEEEISRESGYQKLDHELEFYGVCPRCT